MKYELSKSEASEKVETNPDQPKKGILKNPVSVLRVKLCLLKGLSMLSLKTVIQEYMRIKKFDLKSFKLYLTYLIYNKFSMFNNKYMII